MIGQLGLVVFMFVLGAELRLERLAGRDRVVRMLVAGSVTVPFVFGLGLAAKVGGVPGGAVLTGIGRHQNRRLGFLLNCRGVTEIVIANVGLQRGFITPLAYTVIVLVAVITTVITGPLAQLRRPDADLLPACVSVPRGLRAARPERG